MLRALSATTVAIALLSAAPHTGAADRILPFTPSVETLDNGLTLVVVPFDTPGIVAYYTVVRTGSRDEVAKGKTGFAHFFEHMMFRGTERFPTAKYMAVLQESGADSNAYTSTDYTVYYAIIPAPSLPKIFEIEADRFQHLAYSEADFKTEAGAILGEYNKVFSRPGMKLWETLWGTAFRRHTYKHTVIGDLADVKAMPKGFAFSKRFFRDHYTPDNCTIMLVGDVQPAQARALVEAAYGEWRGTHEAPKIPSEPTQKAPRRAHVDWHAPTSPQLAIAWKVPAFSAETPESAALEVASELLFGESSPLYQALVVDEGVALSLRPPGLSVKRDVGLWTLTLRLKEAASAEAFTAVVERVQAAIDQLAAAPPDAARLESARSHLRYARLMSLDTVGSVAGLLARTIALSGDPEDAERHMQRVASLTPEQLQAAVKAHLVPKNRTVVSLATAPKAKEASK